MKTIRTFVCLGLCLIVSILSKPVFGQLKAQFTSNIQSGCAPLIVTFQDQSKGNPTSLKWNLGNGVISVNNPTPTTTYFNPGVYTIKLTVSNGSATDSLVVAAYITVYANPTANFTGAPLEGCFPLKVNFTNNSSAGSGTITNYNWDFGDGNVSNDLKGAHTYTSAGSFAVTLSVANNYGCTATLSKDNYIHIQNGVNAAFKLNSLNICSSPATAQFINESEGSGNITYAWNFGDGGKSNDTNATHNYISSGTYNVILTAQAAGGCSDTASMPVTIEFPASSFTNTNATCSNQSISFTNTSTPAPLSAQWYFGDGTTSAQLNPSKTYTQTGSYKVKLVNFFSDKCSDTIIKTIIIASGPSPAFNTADTARCSAPLLVHFSNTTTGAIKYVWNFGDGDTSIATNPVHSYTSDGLFDVSLTAINLNGCQTTVEKSHYIKIEPPVITGINNLPDSGCLPLTVKPTISLNTKTAIKSYSWNFGDGGTSSAQNPTYTYTKEGIYKVKVTIVTTDGCTNTFTLNNAVFAGHKPKAAFTTMYDTSCANTGVWFYNASANGPITFLEWNFGPLKDSASGASYYFQPSDTGYHFITLIAFDYGCSDTLVKPHALYALPPFANIQYKLNCTNKNLVAFGDSSIVDVQHTWSFGDGATSVAKNPAHTYASPGIYTVSLYTQNNACKDTATATVHVINEQGIMSLPGSVFCRGNNIDVDVSNINEANVTNTQWNFGDGSVITVNGTTKASHVYVLTGKFKITAVMTDVNGCSYEYASKDSVTVYGPLAGFNSAVHGTCEGSTITFTDSSETDGLHSIIKWSWNYGDTLIHNYNSLTKFSNVYKDTGYFSPVLTVTDSYGCSDSLQRSNYIYITHPQAGFNLSDSILCPGSSMAFKNTSSGVNLTYNWYFGDGKTSQVQNPAYTYPASGKYTASLSVTDVNGCRDSILSKPILVSKPYARFAMSDSFSTCPPLHVNFTNNSTAYKGLNWSFGDGSSSILLSPEHVYTYPGNYQVKLLLKGYGNCSDTLSKNIIIKGPTGILVYNDSALCTPGLVNFFAVNSHTKNYTWDFSDGNAVITTANQTTHTYDTGFFVPKLILTDSVGCKVAIAGTDTIKVYDVTANATNSNSYGCDSARVIFNDVSQSQDKITNHYWYFGDTTSGTGSQVTHTFTEAGNYYVKLIAVTQHGCKDTFRFASPIAVMSSPKITILGDSLGCASSAISFAGTNTGRDTSALQWNWNFNNGSVASGQTVSSKYTNGGNYNVTLTATNKGGCLDSSSKKIHINNLPLVTAGADTSVCQNSSYRLHASGAVSYAWLGENLSCTNCQSPNAMVNSQSTFIVTGKDSIGCAASDTVTLRVISPAPISVSSADTLCVGEKTQLSASGAATYKWIPATYLDNSKSATPQFTAVTDTAINYRVIGYSEKNCFSDTGFVFVKTYPVPKISLQKNEIVVSSGGSVKLNSHSSADITHWQWQPVYGLDNATIANPTASPRQTTNYTCIASNGGGCISRDEILVKVICKNTNVFIPNTFSPNGDGMNDVFFVRGSGLFVVKSMRIFNRWGELIFERYDATPNTESNGWNGTFNQKPLTPDVYVYMMEIVCENGTVIPVKGNITLLR